MKTEIKIIGADIVSRNLENVKQNIDKQLPVSVKDATLFMQNEVKASIAGQRNEETSVDTGRFLNSVDVGTLSKNEAKVFTDLEYAKFLEYGTSKLSPRKHFQNSVFRNKDKIKDEFNNSIKQIIK